MDRKQPSGGVSDGHEDTSDGSQRVSKEEALRRLAQKEVSPAYKSPRGNAALDRDALALSVGASSAYSLTERAPVQQIQQAAEEAGCPQVAGLQLQDAVVEARQQ